MICNDCVYITECPARKKGKALHRGYCFDLTVGGYYFDLTVKRNLRDMLIAEGICPDLHE